jgi:hypothetical protein
MRGRPGRLNSQAASPLPQDEVVPVVENVRVLDAYFQFLPSQQLTFFQRPFLAKYPIPLAQAGAPPYPRNIPLLRLVAPQEACIVLKNSVFKVYEHTGIDPNDVVEVDPTRLTTVFGFQLKVGGRGTLDFMTNLTSKGDPVVTAQGFQTFPPSPGQGSFYPFGGDSQVGLQNFASYVRPGQTIEAAVIALRAPPFETKLLSVEINGFLIPEFQLDRILTRMSGGGT